MIWVYIAISLIVLLSIALAYCVAPGKMTPEAKKAAGAFYGLNCAHRGLHTEDRQVPENSISAFIAAREGNYGVELDVRLSKDEQVVVFHDPDLKRICGVDALVDSLDWDELSKLRLFDTQERMPLLTEVLEVLGDTPLIVEIKTAGDKNAKLCEETLKIMRSYKSSWCIESFDPRIGAWFRKNAPDVLRGQLGCPPLTFTELSRFLIFLGKNMLMNYMSRPHFIAYSNTPRPLAVLLCRAMGSMNFIWTVLPNHNIIKCEKENDTIIFEHYKPAPRFKRSI